MYIYQSVVDGFMFDIVNGLIKGHFGRSDLRIYEAGGGSATIMDADLTRGSEITVVDISPEQIAKMTYAAHGVVGDIQTWEKPDGFDLAICFNVLEHVDDPQAAVRAICRSLAPGGMLVVGGPDPRSLQGWITRLTPHAVHVAFYRLMGQKTAGLPGYAPFPTVFAPSSYPREIARIAQESGLKIHMTAVYRFGHLINIQRRSRLLYGAVRTVFFVLRALSLGTYDPSMANFFIIATRERDAPA
jgi:SAM-dependent methyltransferase